MMGNGRHPQMQLAVTASAALQMVELTVLADGMPIPMGQIHFNLQQAREHLNGVLQAIQWLENNKQSKLILPPSVGRLSQA